MRIKKTFGDVLAMHTALEQHEQARILREHAERSIQQKAVRDYRVLRKDIEFQLEVLARSGFTSIHLTSLELHAYNRDAVYCVMRRLHRLGFSIESYPDDKLYNHGFYIMNDGRAVWHERKA